jgi:hypothetical protein
MVSQIKAEGAFQQAGHLLICAYKLVDCALDPDFIPATPFTGRGPAASWVT